MFDTEQSTRTSFSVVAVQELSVELKRLLKVQFKEFIHHIEDHEELKNTRKNSTVLSLYSHEAA